MLKRMAAKCSLIGLGGAGWDWLGLARAGYVKEGCAEWDTQGQVCQLWAGHVLSIDWGLKG